MSNVFSLSGRATRSEWWLIHLFSIMAGTLIFIILAGLLIEDLGDTASDEPSAEDMIRCAISFLIGCVVMTILTFTVTVRRLHDRGRSGLFLLVYWFCGCIPFVNVVTGLIYFVDLGLMDGVVGSNQWGGDPKSRRGVFSQDRVAANDKVVVNVGTFSNGVADDRLSRLERLRKLEIITEEEYAEQRRKIIKEI